MVNPHLTGIIILDIVSAGAVLGTLAGILPPLAAFGAVVWYAIQIWESQTVQGWLKKKEE